MGRSRKKYEYEQEKRKGKSIRPIDLSLISEPPEEHIKNISLIPQNKNQEHFIASIYSHEVCAAIGPAGVGKTYCAAGVVSQLFIHNQIDGIILTRANVKVGNSIGLLPGTIEEKMTPLLLPILDALKRHLGDGKYHYMLNKKQIEMLPFEYVRGRSFLNKAVIIDESQNLTPEDVIAIITRYESGKIIFLGDPVQNDLKGECGLVWLSEFSKRHKLKMPITLFSTNDIVRSEFVRNFIKVLYKEKNIPSKFSVNKEKSKLAAVLL